MAIEKTYFPVLTNLSDNEYYTHLRDYIAPYFTANATEYFDNIVFDEADNTLKCYLGELLALSIYYSSNRVKIDLTLPNGSSNSYHCYLNKSSYSSFIRSATKTSKGIGFSFNVDGSDYNTSFYITKTNKGNTAIVALAGTSNDPYNITASTSNYVLFADFTSQEGFQKLTSTATNIANYSNKTCLVPFSLKNSDDYISNVSFAFFYQTTLDTTIELNGVKYANSYYFALKDE